MKLESRAQANAECIRLAEVVGHAAIEEARVPRVVRIDLCRRPAVVGKPEF